MSSDGADDFARMLKVTEAAALVRVSKMTVYRMIHSGELPAVKFGGRNIRVDIDVLRSLLLPVVKPERSDETDRSS